MIKLKMMKNNKIFGKMIIGLTILVVLVVTSFITAFASTVECKVIDGDTTYEFVLANPTVDGIAQKAVDLGMPMIEENDYTTNVDGDIVITRALTLTVNSNENLSYLVAYEGETVCEVLENYQIEYSEYDALSMLSSTVLNTDSYVEIYYYTPVTITVDEIVYEVGMYGGTVQDAIDEAGIELDFLSYVTPSTLTSLEYGMEIEVGEQAIIQFDDIDGTLTTYNASGMNTQEFLETYDIEVPENAKISLDYETELVNGDVITMRIVEEVTEIEEISYDTSYTNSSSMSIGSSKVSQTGSNGSKEVTYEYTYVNGEVESITAVSETVLTEPVTEIIVQGTKISVDTSSSDDTNTFTDMYGNVVEYSMVYVEECTAYSEPGGITSTGQTAQVGIVAVDPSIIPYGTVMYITSGSVVYGYCVAGDTGAAMRNGNAFIDLYYNTTEECFEFGRRDMTIYIIE